jgi:hypothetical protein
MKLDDLVGRHSLSGVDFESEPGDDCNDYHDSMVCRFVVDDITYAAIEDPSDGYRSAMQDILISKKKIKNKFKPVKVFAHMAHGKYSCDDKYILEIYDEKTGKLVLEMGTDSSDVYYPSFVANFSPENMVCNIAVGKKILKPKKENRK